nr:ribosome biogenesis GTP-binding protein YihA/YsxC [bacterium]
MAEFSPVKFIASAEKLEQRNRLRMLPEIALCGRSNAGKSSLLNALCGNSKLARVSSTPGRTRLINTFEVEGRFYIVDLPGYGYAAASRKQQQSWGGTMPEYLAGSQSLRLVLMLCDIRHEPAEGDRQLSAWLAAQGIPYLVAATKCDLVPRASYDKRRMDMAFALKVNFVTDVIPVSAKTGAGLHELAKRMEDAVSGRE